MSFLGRSQELALLETLYRRDQFNLVTIQGRRRIGKSTLVHYFAKKMGCKLFEFQGLPPREKQNNQDQINYFAIGYAQYLKIKSIHFDDWSEALNQLENLQQKNKIIILLDEISWMGGKDLDFPGKLKNVCDYLNQEGANILLILCGSVSSWIQKNILNNTGFVGRISAEITLRELSLIESKQLILEKNKKIKNIDVIKLLSLTGGVPKYIEELSPKETLENNLSDFFFNPGGFFFKEFDAIFNDIFGKKQKLYKDILLELNKKPSTIKEITESLNLPLNGDSSEYLTDLEQAGFIKKYTSWNLTGNPSKIYQFRITDNYTKFYLTHVYKRKSRLINLPPRQDAYRLISWPIAFGFQLENLVLNNFSLLVKRLRIDENEIENIGPYFQPKTKAKRGVQIDLLIQCKRKILHLCEIKSGANLSSLVVKEVQEKNKWLKKPKGYAIFNHLIFLEPISQSIHETDFFDKIISIEELLD